MKVLHVLNYAWPYIDGYTTRSIGLTTAQRCHLDGVEVAIATSPFEPLAQSVDEGFRTEHWGPDMQIRATRWRGDAPHAPRSWERPAIGVSPATSAVFAAELESVARRVAADVIHVHHPHYVADVALRVAERLGLPGVYELRCFNGNYDLGTRSPYRTLRGRWQNALEFALARDASAVVTISDGLAAQLLDNGVARDRLFVVRNSVDTERFRPAPPRDPADGSPWADRRARHATPGGALANGAIDGDDPASSGPSGVAPLPLHVGYATTFERMENLDSAVEAACTAHAALARRGIELTLTLAGGGRDWSRIAELVARRGADAFVRLPGHVSYADMPDFYRSLDLFLVPRGAHVVAMDTTPLKPLEALASGLPLLVTDLPAMRELLASRPDVRFTAPDADAMAQALIGFADAPWRGTGEIAERAWPREIARYEAVYAAALANGPPRSSGRRRLSGRVRRAVAGARSRGARAATGAGAVLGGASGGGGCRHVVACGFPRTGSTVLQVIVESCVPGVRTFEGEVEALDVGDAMTPGRLFSKCPDDVFRLERIAAPSGDTGFLLNVRDPRDIMTSRHAAYPGDRGYYVTPERFVATWEALRAARERDDATLLRYEDLVARPEEIEALFAERFGWRAEWPFARFHERAARRERDSMTDGALGGLRPLEPGGVARWRDEEHRERLATLVRTMPELAAACIDLGYEKDTHWTTAFADGLPKASAEVRTEDACTKAADAGGSGDGDDESGDAVRGSRTQAARSAHG